jgi:hypothetical protein
MQGASHTVSIDEERRWRLVRVLLAFNLVAFVAMYLSGQWDIAEHAKGAVDTFWYPPHYGIYFGLLVAALIPLTGLIVLLRAPGLPFDKVRANPALVLVIVANGLGFSGAPFDAWWHQTFGLDLTVWSPPHLHLVFGTVLAALSCAVYFLDESPLHAPLQLFRSISGRQAMLIFTLAWALLMAAVLFIEYEGGVQTPDVRARPLWSYPLLWPGFAVGFIALFAAFTRSIGMASVVMVAYMLVRLAILGFDQVVLDFRGFPAYPLIIPALVFDLVLVAMLGRARERRLWETLAIAGLVTSAVIVLTTPLFWSWMDITPRMNVSPWRDYWLIGLGSGMLGTYLGWWCGSGLRRLRPKAQVAQPAVFDTRALVH